MADVARAERAEHGIGQRVDEHVGVGVALEALVVRELDAAEKKFAALDEGMDVITNANAIHKNRLPCLKSRQQQGEGASVRGVTAARPARLRVRRGGRGAGGPGEQLLEARVLGDAELQRAVVFAAGQFEQRRLLRGVDQREVEVGVAEVRVELDRLAEFLLRDFLPALLRAGAAEIVVGLRRRSGSSALAAFSASMAFSYWLSW